MVLSPPSKGLAQKLFEEGCCETLLLEAAKGFALAPRFRKMFVAFDFPSVLLRFPMFLRDPLVQGDRWRF